MAARSTQKSSPVAAPSLEQIVGAVLAAMQGQTEAAPASKPATASKPRTSKPKTAPAPRSVKPENAHLAASSKQVMGAFFEAFQVIYGDKLSGWPTRGDMEAIRADLQARIAK